MSGSSFTEKRTTGVTQPPHWVVPSPVHLTLPRRSPLRAVFRRGKGGTLTSERGPVTKS